MVVNIKKSKMADIKQSNIAADNLMAKIVLITYSRWSLLFFKIYSLLSDVF